MEYQCATCRNDIYSTDKYCGFCGAENNKIESSLTTQVTLQYKNDFDNLKSKESMDTEDVIVSLAKGMCLSSLILGGIVCILIYSGSIDRETGRFFLYPIVGILFSSVFVPIALVYLRELKERWQEGNRWRRELRETERRNREQESRENRARENEIREIRKKNKWNQYRELRKVIEAMPQYEHWRQEVFRRHGKKCSICGSDKDIEVDHRYRSFHQIIRENGITNIIEAYECASLWDVDNGAPVCKLHHDQTKSSQYYNKSHLE